MGLFVEIMSACLTGSNLGIEASSFANRNNSNRAS